MLSGLSRRLAAVFAFTLLVTGGIALAQSELNPIPQGSFPEGAADTYLGTGVTIPARFENTGPDTGYGPYLDVVIPAGSDLEYESATFLGRPFVIADEHIIEIADSNLEQTVLRFDEAG